MVTPNTFKDAAAKILAAADDNELQQLTAADLRNYIKKLGAADDPEIIDDTLNEWIANEVVKRLGSKMVKTATVAAEPYAFKNSKPKQSVLLSKRTRLDTLELGVQQAIDSVLWDEANMFTICPFQVIMGANYSTNAGRKDLSSEVTDYSTLKMVIDGKDTLSVYWRGSYDKPFFEDWKDPSDHNKGTKNIRLTKQLKVGLSYKAFVNKESVNIEFGGLGEGNNMLALQFVESFTAKIPYFNINETFFKRTTSTQSGRTKELLNFDRQQAYLWVVPEVLTTQNYNYADVVNQNKVYFMMTQIINVQRNPLDKKVLWIECEFRSVNDRLSKSGLTINQFITNGMIGEPTAWPLVTIDEETNKSTLTLNPLNLAYLPVTHRQITVQGLNMYCGSLVQGWPLYFDNNRMIVSNKFYIPKNNKIDYQRPSLLLWRKFQRPLTDIFNLNKAPESDFYITPIQLQTITSMSALRDIRRWEQGAVEINPIEALFKYSKETFNTNYAVKNPSDNSGYSPGLKMPYWDTNFLNDTKQLTPKQQNSSWYSATHIWYGAGGIQPIAKVVVSGNDYFNYNSDETTDIVEACKKTREGKAVNVFEYGDTINGSTVTYYGIRNKDLAHWLFFNAVILKTVTTLPLAQDNNFALENRILGAFQNFLHIITFGLVPRWSRVSANQHPGFPFMAGLFPAGVLDNYRNLFNYSESGKSLASAANAVMNFAAGGGVLKPILGGGSDVDNPLGENHLPLNIFADNEMSLWFGAKNTTTAIAGELSHVITTDTFKLNGTKTTRMTVTTGDIGQQITIKGSSGKYTEKRVVLINEATKIESRDTVLSDYAEKPSGACVGYMINQRHDCVLGGKTIQDKYFSLQSTDTGGELTIKDQNCIYYDMVQTRNAFNKNLRLIWNHRRIGNPLFNFGLDPDDPNFSYPDDLMPVPPDPLPSYTWSYNLKTFKSADWSGFFSQSPDTSKLRGCFNTQIKDKSYFIKATNWITFPETTSSYDWISGKQLTSSGSHGGIVFALPFKPLRNATDWIRKVTTYFSFNGVVQSKTSINLMLNSAIKNPSRIFNFSSPAQKIEWSGEVITYFDKPQTVRTKISKQKQVYFFINPFAAFNTNRVSGHDSYTVSQPIYAKFDAYWDFTLINGYDLTNAYIKIEFDVIIDYPNQTINPVANLKFSLTTDNDNTLNYHAKNNYAYQGGKRGVAFTGDAAQYLDNYYNGVVFSDLKISTQIKEAVIHDYKN